MNAVRLLLLGGALLAAGCSGPGGPRVGDLADRPVPTVADLPAGDPDQLAREALEQYQAFAERQRQSRLDAEARRRAADLRLELMEQAEARAVEALERQEGEAQALPEPDYAALAAAYRKLLDDYPDYEHNDEVLYQLAKVLLASGDTEGALDALRLLTREHPFSPLYDEAQFRLGENLFLEERYAEAAEAYAEVVRSGDGSPFHDFALYKYGWSKYALERYAEALDAFFLLLDRRLARLGPVESVAELPADERETLADVLRSISLSLYRQKGPETLADYFAHTGERSYDHLIYTALADFYVKIGLTRRVIETHRAYIARHPDGERAPHLQLAIIALLTELADKEALLAAKRTLVERYLPGAPWWQGREPYPALVEQVRATLEELAKHYHAVARRSGDPGAYLQAVADYRSYIETFPGRPDTPALNLLLAEALAEQGALEEAIAEYERTAYDYPPHPQAAEAGYAALLAYERHIATLPEALAEDWRRFAIDSALRFEAAFPGHPQALAVLTRAADALFRLDDKARAAQVAEAVLKRADAPAELRRNAATILAHTRFDEGDYLAAESYYQQALALTPPQEAARRAELGKALAAAIYKQGEALREGGDAKGAAETFLRAAAVPGSAIAANARFDAAAALIGAGLWEAAVAPLEAFRKHHASHPLYSDARRKLALAYQKSGRKAEAARELEMLSWSQQEPPQVQREALWQAARLYAEAGDDDRQKAALENYLRRFPSPLEPAMEARNTLAELAGKRGDEASRRHWLNALVEAFEQAGEANTPRTRELAAHAALALADTSLARFEKVKLVEPIEKNLALKRRYLKSALAAYEKCADYGVAEVVTAATYRIAELYNEFSKALWDSERPRGLDELALEQYELMLEEQAIPFEEKAIEIHEANVRRTQEEGIYTRWSALSFERLGEIFPARYGKRETRRELFTSLR